MSTPLSNRKELRTVNSFAGSVGLAAFATVSAGSFLFWGYPTVSLDYCIVSVGDRCDGILYFIPKPIQYFLLIAGFVSYLVWARRTQLSGDVDPTEKQTAQEVRARMLAQIEVSRLAAAERARAALTAAELGDAEAQFTLATMYGDGEGVDQDLDQMFDWMHKAADQGYAKAQDDLACMYLSGLPGPAAEAKGLSWRRRAADQGYAPAQAGLAVMYMNGDAVRQDYVEAYKWQLIAGDHVSWAAGERDRLAALMTPTQLSEGKKRADEWVATSIRLGLKPQEVR